MKFFRIVSTLALVALFVFSTAAFAQDMPPLPGELILGDLHAPRGVTVDSSGTMYVVDAGRGGDVTVDMPAIDDPSATVPVSLGLSGVVWAVNSDGTATPALQGMPSYAMPTETVGLYRAIPRGDSWWLVMSSAGRGAYWGSSVVELDAAGMTSRVISLYPYEAANNPDGNEIDSNAADIAWTDDGTLLIVDAGANALLSWTEADGLATVVTWPGNDVPTSIEIGANGDIYIGFLGAGIAPGAGKVERWSNGELVETFGGLTGVTDIALDGDTVYAVQLFLFGEAGPGPGSVVRIDADGTMTPVAEGLLAPFGIAVGSDGALYVSYGTIAFAPGMTGGVIRVPGM